MSSSDLHGPNATLANLAAIEQGDQLPKGVVESLISSGLAERDGDSPGHALLTPAGKARLTRLRKEAG